MSSVHPEGLSAYHSPGTLDAKLDAEGACGKCAEARRQDPKRNERSSKENEDAERRRQQGYDADMKLERRRT